MPPIPRKISVPMAPASPFVLASPLGATIISANIKTTMIIRIGTACGGAWWDPSGRRSQFKSLPIRFHLFSDLLIFRPSLISAQVHFSNPTGLRHRSIWSAPTAWECARSWARSDDKANENRGAASKKSFSLKDGHRLGCFTEERERLQITAHRSAGPSREVSPARGMACCARRPAATIVGPCDGAGPRGRSPSGRALIRGSSAEFVGA